MRRGLQAAGLVVVLASAALPVRGAEGPPTVGIWAGAGHLEAEVAATPEARHRGLMGREYLDPDRAMLFVWPREGPRVFWMKDTRIPLSVAFLDGQGRVLNVEGMQPLREDRFYGSQGGARFALEANRGWFRRYGVERGNRLRFRIPAKLLPGDREEDLTVGSP